MKEAMGKPALHACYCLFIYLFYLLIQYFTRVTLLATLAILPRGPLKNIYTYVHTKWKKKTYKMEKKTNIKFTLSTQVKHTLKP